MQPRGKTEEVAHRIAFGTVSAREQLCTRVWPGRLIEGTLSITRLDGCQRSVATAQSSSALIAKHLAASNFRLGLT
jgi:hypothetical protein